MSEERAHALLSASSASRWLKCTPSARFEETFPESSSSYADEGTAAHELASYILNLGADKPPDTPDPRQSPFYNAEMEEAVGIYVDLVLERYAEAKKRSRDAIHLVEQRLDYSEWAPEGFGTGDVVIIADEIIEVIDLKYGKGVPVYAEENPQLRLYGLGALGSYGLIYDIEKIRTTIIQPRLDHITTDEITVKDLETWGGEYIKPRAIQAHKGEGDWIPGDHCRFCRGKAVCKARAEANKALADRYSYAKANILKPHDIGQILGGIAEMIAWANDVKDYALEQSERNGVKWPGWKLVAGKSSRKISDADAAIKALTGRGYQEPLLYKPRELLGITELEKLVGKKALPEILGEIIIKPAGKPALVPESDKRPELNTASSAAAAFAEPYEE